MRPCGSRQVKTKAAEQTAELLGRRLQEVLQARNQSCYGHHTEASPLYNTAANVRRIQAACLQMHGATQHYSCIHRRSSILLQLRNPKTVSSCRGSRDRSQTSLSTTELSAVIRPVLGIQLHVATYLHWHGSTANRRPLLLTVLAVLQQFSESCTPCTQTQFSLQASTISKTSATQSKLQAIDTQRSCPGKQYT